MSQTYQSRVFSFITSRTNQLKDTCVKSWRQLKVRVIWGGQILIHPLQILAQATKILKPQLPPSKPQLPQPTPDIDLEDALSLIQTAGYSIEIDIPPSALEPTESTLTYQPPRSNFIVRALNSILRRRGYANGKSTEILKFNSSTDDRSLVNNSRADLAQFDSTLDDSPKETLCERQINYTPTKPTIRGLSSRLSDRQIVLVTTENQLIDTLTIAQQQQIRRCIGIDLATTWERWQTSTFKPQQTTQILPDRSQLLLTSETSLPTESLLDRFNNWLYNFSHQESPEIPPIKPKLSPRKTIAPSAYPETLIATIISPIENRSFYPEPRYLDLPQLPPIIETDVDISPKSPNIFTKLQPDWLKHWWGYYRDYMYVSNNSCEIVRSVEEFKLTPIEPKYDIMKLDSKIRQSRSNNVSTKLSTKSNQDLEYYPDWIDATAEDVGYVRSPLSKILMWLDRIMVGIENWLIKIWNAIVDRRESILQGRGSANDR
jgi:hypothetical protein